MAPFHYLFHVRDLDEARRFYGGLIGCLEGRSAETWVDFDFFGNQISLHLGAAVATQPTGHVDGIAVPLPHFGAVLGWDLFHEVAVRLANASVEFVLSPRIRFPGAPGEQATMFFLDPSGNALELKAFRDPAQIFAA